MMIDSEINIKYAIERNNRFINQSMHPCICVDERLTKTLKQNKTKQKISYSLVTSSSLLYTWSFKFVRDTQSRLPLEARGIECMNL